MPILRSSTRHPDQLFTSANQGHWKFSIVVMDQSVLEVIEKSGYISSPKFHLIIVGHEGALQYYSRVTLWYLQNSYAAMGHQTALFCCP